MSTDFESEVSIDVHDDSVLPRAAEDIQPITIKWTLEVEMRSWGVKGFYVHVPDQKVMVIYQIWAEDGESILDQEKEITLTNVQVDLDNVQITHSIAPQTLDFYKGQAAVIF